MSPNTISSDQLVLKIKQTLAYLPQGNCHRLIILICLALHKQGFDFHREIEQDDDINQALLCKICPVIFNKKYWFEPTSLSTEISPYLRLSYDEWAALSLMISLLADLVDSTTVLTLLQETESICESILPKQLIDIYRRVGSIKEGAEVFFATDRYSYTNPLGLIEQGEKLVVLIDAQADLPYLISALCAYVFGVEKYAEVGSPDNSWISNLYGAISLAPFDCIIFSLIPDATNDFWDSPHYIEWAGIDSLNINGTLILATPLHALGDASYSSKREYIIDNNLLDKIILLPSHLCTYEGEVLLILKKDRLAHTPIRHIDLTHVSSDSTCDWSEQISGNGEHIVSIPHHLLNSYDSYSFADLITLFQHADVPAKDAKKYTRYQLGELIAVAPCETLESFRSIPFLTPAQMDIVKSDASSLSECLNKLTREDLEPRFYEDFAPPLTVVTTPTLFISRYKGNACAIYASADNPVCYDQSLLSAFNFKDENIVCSIDYLALIINSQEIRDVLKFYGICSKSGTMLYIWDKLMYLPIDIKNDIDDQNYGVEIRRREVAKRLLSQQELNNIIEETKNDMARRLQVKRHRLAPRVGNLANYLNLLASKVEACHPSPLPLDTPIGKSETFKTILDKLTSGMNELAEEFKELTLENSFGVASNINTILHLHKIITSYKGRIAIEHNLADIPKEEEMAYSLLICPADFKEMIESILENAIRHGFASNPKNGDCVRAHVLFREDTLSLQISNNGTAFPADMDDARFFTEDEYAGATGNSGLGGYRIKSIAEHFGDKVSLELNATAQFPVSINIQFKK